MAEAGQQTQTSEDTDRDSKQIATVLIVDDTPANLTLLSGMLLERGYVVKVATHGKRALAIAAASKPDLVMLDITMPEMDGYEVCRTLKARPETRDVPVLFLSALDEVGDKLQAFRAGGVDYVTKPFQVEEVLARVETQVRLSRLQRALERRERELERQNAELARRNAELVAAQKRTDRVFATLADVLPAARWTASTGSSAASARAASAPSSRASTSRSTATSPSRCSSRRAATTRRKGSSDSAGRARARAGSITPTWCRSSTRPSRTRGSHTW